LRYAAVVVVGLAMVLLTAAWLLPRVSDAASRWLEEDPVRARAVAVDGVEEGDVPVDLDLTRTDERRIERRGTAIVDAGIQFNLLGAFGRERQQGGASAEAATVVLRVSADGDRWSPWITLELEPAPREQSEPTRSAVAGRAELVSEPVWVGEARFVEFRRSGPVRDLRFSFTNSLGDATLSDRLAGSLRSAVTAIAGIGRTGSALADEAVAPGMPAIVTRQQWGADERWRRAAPWYADVKMAFVHHTAGLNSYTAEQAPAVVRAVYSYHARTLGFNDIGYNFLVDRFGVIYEGRYGGMDQGVVGAQVLGFNTGSTGVSVMGHFVDEAPPAAALDSLARLLAWKLGVHGIDPTSPVTMRCGTSDKFKAGQYVTLPAISAHRDANYTTCPGDAFYAALPGVREAAEGLSGAPRVLHTKALRNFGIRRGRVAVFRFKVVYAAGSADTQTYTRGVVILKVRDAKGRSRYTKVYKAARLNRVLRHSRRLFLRRGTYRYFIYASLPDGTKQQKLGSGRIKVR
jgi:hypothetical protein